MARAAAVSASGSGMNSPETNPRYPVVSSSSRMLEKSRCPAPGCQRLESATWKWKMRSPQVLNAVSDIGFLDVHVEGVEQQTEVVLPDALDEIQALGGGVDEVGLVAIHGLEGEAHAGALGGRRALLDGLDQVVHRLVVGLTLGGDAADQTEDDDGVEMRSQRDVARNAFDRRRPHAPGRRW